MGKFQFDREYVKTVGKALWDVEHIFLFSRQCDTKPFSEGFRTFADIHDNIKDRF